MNHGQRLIMVGQQGQTPRGLDDRFTGQQQPLSWVLDRSGKQFGGEVVALPSLDAVPSGVTSISRQAGPGWFPLDARAFSMEPTEGAEFSVDLSGDLAPFERVRDKSLTALTWSGPVPFVAQMDEDLPSWLPHLLDREPDPMVGVAQWGTSNGYGHPVELCDEDLSPGWSPGVLDLRVLRRASGVFVTTVPVYATGRRGTVRRKAFESRIVLVSYGFEGSVLELRVDCKVRRGHAPAVWGASDVPTEFRGLLRRAQNLFNCSVRQSRLQRAYGPRVLKRAALPERYRIAG